MNLIDCILSAHLHMQLGGAFLNLCTFQTEFFISWWGFCIHGFLHTMPVLCFSMMWELRKEISCSFPKAEVRFQTSKNRYWTSVEKLLTSYNHSEGLLINAKYLFSENETCLFLEPWSTAFKLKAKLHAFTILGLSTTRPWWKDSFWKYICGLVSKHI